MAIKKGYLIDEESHNTICACCFHTIANGEEHQIRPGGRSFHATCVRNYPRNYYVNLERSIYRLELEKEKKNEK